MRVEKIRDLMAPFKKRHLYRGPMGGFDSIKKILPVLVPDLYYRESCSAADPQPTA